MSCKSIPHEVDLLPPVHVVPVKEEHLVNEEAVPNPSRSQQNSGYPEGNVDGCPGWTKQTKIRKGHRQAQETRVDEYQIATNPSLYLPAPLPASSAPQGNAGQLPEQSLHSLSQSQMRKFATHFGQENNSQR